MKTLKLFTTISFILGFLSVIALIFLFLALSDIADGNENLTLEWYVAGVSIMILSAFTTSTFINLSLIMKNIDLK